ncbi:endonuclease [Acinetobacter phage SH-Ab 15599]|nr:endonuclease [Acinetobacter phage SH-Ab 15599]
MLKIEIDSPVVAFIGDLHFGIKNGDKWFLEFQVAYMKRKLDQMKALGIKYLLQAGDALDNRKRTETNVIDALQEVNEYANALGIIIIYIVGNHNTFYTDTNAVHNLNIIQHMSNVAVVDEQAVLTYKGADVILLLAWIHKNNIAKMMEVVEASTAPYCMMHAEFDGFEMYKGIEAKGGMSIVPFRRFSKVFSGHYHTVSEDGNIKYVGSPYALTWMDYVDGTNRGWFELDLRTGQETFHKNDETETLFFVDNYDPTFEYNEAYFDKLKNKIVKFFVKEVPDQKHFDKYVKLINSIPFIDRRIIDEREIAAIEHATVDIKTMNLTPVKVIDEYVRKEATNVNLNPDLVAAEALSLYNHATGMEG